MAISRISPKQRGAARATRKHNQDASTLSLSEIAYRTIEEMIVKQELPPGSMVSEAELGGQLNCGRTPIREALLRLKLEGYIEIHPRRGALVTSVDILGQLELLEVRRPLEELVARLAARRATEDERRHFKALIKDIRQAAKDRNRHSFYEANKAVHLSLAKATHNPTLSKAVNRIHAHSRRFWYSHTGHDQLAAAADCHANVLKQIIKGDADAAANAANSLIDYLETLTREAVDRRG